MVFTYNLKIQILFLSITGFVLAQQPQMIYKSESFWQQQADYFMEIDMNVDTYQYTGTQKLIYTNNSPDILNKVFYHLYFNAFQPGSEMDARIQSLPDPDKRVVDNLGTDDEPVYESKIGKLKPNEIGFIEVQALEQNGKNLDYEIEDTVMEVVLAKPIQPGEQVEFDMVFKGQVPIQIRRAGRNNEEDVALSMAQWYPKIAEYDDEGWHANSYIGREFYAVWGNYNVKITIDKDYTVGGTGYLQNPEAIGHGYGKQTENLNSDKLTWHFTAPNVHDFAWAADPDYKHDVLVMNNGPVLHFLYKESQKEEYLKNWTTVQPITEKIFKYFNEKVGPYPYKQYSLIQAGDGGMEYGMCTFMDGHRTFDRFLGTAAHEIGHSWFQFVLASNEFKHEWLDEGFCSYIEDEALNVIKGINKPNAQETAYERYIKFVNTGDEEPLTTHADRYKTNKAYSRAAYSKGAIFLSQLRYVIGKDNVANAIKKYYQDFAFKHPRPMDFIRIAEKVSGLELDWYYMEFGQTTNTIDYAIKKIDKRSITLERIGAMPMPIDVTVTYTDGTTEDFYIPLRQMRGEKPTSAKTLQDWAWAFPSYSFSVKKRVSSVQIDPSGLMADVNRDNNLMSKEKIN